ncbi:MAG: (d)CMP kinase [Acidobacteria bacterium]|nr:(d)CMP kinase [Acidobacteriota bacterium]
MSRRLLIAIDGPSGAGKSTVARLLAHRLGYTYIDSGAMYRGLALLALDTGARLDDGTALARLASNADMRFEWRGSRNHMLLNGRDVTETIRTPEVSDAASKVSVHAEVRAELVRRQRELGREGGVVMEGRDIGTKVFPYAELKVFLDASLEARSQRRFLDPDVPGQQSRAAVLREIAERDRRDQDRAESPLIPAPDAITVDSTDLTIEQVVEKIMGMVDAAIQKSGTLT